MEAVDLNLEWLKSALARRAWEGVSNPWPPVWIPLLPMPQHNPDCSAETWGWASCMPLRERRTGFSILGWHALCGRKSSGPFRRQCWLRADLWWEPAGPGVPLLPYLPTHPRQCQRWIVTHFSTELTQGLRILLNTTSGHCLNLSHLGLGFLQVTWTNPPPRTHIPSRSHRVNPS